MLANAAASLFMLRLAIAGVKPSRESVIYRDLRWEVSDVPLGLFNRIIGSDVLYESSPADQQAATIVRHATDDADIMNTDPERGDSTSFI